MQPYTPDTVRYIASASGSCTPEQIARYLGWDMEQLQKIARKHAIDLRIPLNEPVPRDRRTTPFTYATTADEVSYGLRGQARDVFDVLRKEHSGGFLIGLEIASRTFINPDHIQNALFKLKKKLQGSRFYVEKEQGWRGGYRLAEHRRS